MKITDYKDLLLDNHSNLWLLFYKIIKGVNHLSKNNTN